MVSNPERDGSRGPLPPYQVLRSLARGGMGEVLLAVRREGTFTRGFAMKRLHPHLREDPEVRSMFLDEARIAGLLSHPHLISVVDVGENEDGPFLVMDYVQGVSVAQVIQRAIAEEREIPLQFAIHVARQAASGLQAAHEATTLDGKPLHLVHRDVSPHNLLVGYDGMTRVTDFGIARAIGRSQQTSTGVLKGKLGYMSPEQLSFQGQDQRSDLFSFGVTFFELLAARRLYPSSDGEKTARRILDEPPPDIVDDRDDVPPELAQLLFQLLAKDASLRPQSAAVVSATLQEIEISLNEELGPFRADEFLQEMFADERDREAALLTQSLEQAAEVSPLVEEETVATRRQRRRPWLGPAVAAGALLVSGAAALAVMGTSEEPGDATAARPETPEPEETPENVEPSKMATSSSTIPPTQRPAGAELEEGMGSAVSDAGDDSEPRRDAKESHAASETKSRTKPAPSKPSGTSRKTSTGVETWEW